MNIQATRRPAGTPRRRRWLITALTLAAAMICTLLGPVEAASAANPEDFSLTLSATDLGMDPSYIQKVVPEVQAEITEAGSLSNAIRQEEAAYPVDDTPVDTATMGNFDGTVTMTSDGTGITLTVPASELQITASWWASFGAAVAGFLAGVGLRVLCVGILTATGFGAGTVPLVCTPLGGATAGLIQAVIIHAIDKDLSTPQAAADIIVKTLVGAVGGYAWEKWASPFAKTYLPTAFKDIGGWLVNKAPWLSSRFGSALGNGAEAAGQQFVELEEFIAAELAAWRSTNATSVPPLRILPFGDSITYGIGSSTTSSYRGDLQTALNRGVLDKTSTSYQFVGSQSSGSMAQPANEGHPGWRIDQLTGIEPCTIKAYMPNLVLLHIGTNDINANLDLGAAPDRLMALIDGIFKDDPSVTVLVGSMMGTTWSPTITANMATFNTTVSTRINALHAAGRRVAWVDMGAVTTADMADGLHPDDAGYGKMSDAWVAGIQRMAAEGAIAPPTPADGGSGGGLDLCGAGFETPIAPGPIPWTEMGVIAGGVTNRAPAGQVQFADLNGDGRADYIDVHPDSSVTAYLNGGVSPSGGAIPWTELGQIASGVAGGAPASQIRFADLNGDGRADYLYVHSDSSVTAYLNGGVPSSGGAIPWTELGQIAGGVAGGAPANQIQFADLNGDGRADYLYVHSDSSVTAYLNGGVSGGPIPWTELGKIAGGVVGGAPANQIRFTDLNGDGRADYLYVHSDSSVTAYLNGGVPSSGGAIPWTELGQIAGGVAGGAPADQIQFADLNADRKADYINVHPDTSVTAYLNQAASSSPKAGAIPWKELGQIASGVVGDRIQFADLNGDNRADYIDVHPDSSVTAYLNGGVSPSGGPIPWTELGVIAGGVVGGAPASQIHFADLNGDGRADYLYVHSDSSVTAYLNGGVSPSGGPIPWTELGLIAGGVVGGAPASQIH
ncbi:FG-GAP-like repeat-containing protein, partial [Streptomyces sp. NPDC087856]|uniref:FG-GAP-like repeat-containing protein n=1 Tax=Streptomyces sp. NPDC087856 TaxID=3365811 RepID=UPI0038287509